MSMFGSQRTLAVAVTAKVDQYVTAMQQADRATTDFAKRVEADGKRVQRAQKTTGTTAAAAAREQERATKTAATAMERAAAKQELAAKRTSAAHQQASHDVNALSTTIGLTLVAAAGAATMAYANFDKQLSSVQAVSNATAGEMKQLSAAAIQAGKDTTFSASEAAQAEGELAKVGLNTSEIVGGALTGSLNLAAAGQIGLAEAATTAGQTMKIFKLGAQDVPAIADALAAGANKSAANVDDLTAALSQGGLVAAQTGLTMTDTVGTLSAFADNALLGSDAGTSLKTMLQRLTPQSKEAAAAMEQIGFDAYDAQGNFVGITEVAEQLRTGLGKLTVEQRQQALATIFGSDAVRGASVLYDLGAKGLEKYITGVQDSGAAARVAAVQTDNLAGDLERLRGSIETSLIQSGGAANGVLRELVQSSGALVDIVNNLPGPVKNTGVALAAVAGAGLLFTSMLNRIIVRSAATKAAMETLGVTGGRLSGKLGSAAAALQGPWGLAVAGGVAALGLFASRHAEAKARVESFTDAIRADSGALSTNARMVAFKALQDAGAVKGARSLGVSMEDATSAALGQADAIGRVNAALEDAAVNARTRGGTRNVTTEEAGAQLALKKAINGTNETVREATQAFKDQEEAVGSAGQSTADAAVGVQDLGSAFNGTIGEVRTLDDELQDFSGLLDTLYAQTFGVTEAQDAFRGSLTAMGDQAKIAHGKVTGNSEATLDLRDKMRGAFRAALDVVDAYAKTGASSDQVAEKSKQVRDQFIKVATDAKISKEEIRKYADAFDQVPAEASTAITVKGVETAMEKIAGLSEAIRNIPSLQAAIYNASGVNGNGPTPKNRSTSRVRAQAEGGFIPGPPSKADTVPAMLSTGEYVITSAAVQKYGLTFFDQVNTRKYATGGLVRSEATAVPVQRFASGGMVDAPRRWIPASAAGAPSSAAPVVIEQHNHYHLDGAAVAGTARAYAAEVDRVQASRTRNALRYGSART